MMNDLIRREDALDAIQKRADKIDSVYSAFWEGLIIARDAVKNVPSAEPEPKWTPVTEALPEDMDRILVTIVRSDGEKRVRSGDYYKGYFMMDNGDTWNGTDKEVIAWMPLPEAWGGEK